MTEPKISIIIPAYNIEKYLARTLDSVLAQTYKNLEVIVVNDGSKDGTGQIMDRYAAQDPRMRAIHKENGGVTSARLRGVEEAAGAWIGFVDGDDLLEPDMYERLLANALKYEADISHCGYQMVFPDGHIDYYHNTRQLRQQDRITGLRDLLDGSLIEPGLVNKLYRGELMRAFLAEGSMEPGIKINEDVLMNYYLFKAAKRAVFEDVCLYHYVLRKGSAATAKLNENKLADPLRVTKIIFRDTQNVPELRSTVLIRLARQTISVATMACGEQKELILPFRRTARKELRALVPAVLKEKGCGLKLKLMTLWAAVLPGTYGWVHTMYLKRTGLDKIYDLG